MTKIIIVEDSDFALQAIVSKLAGFSDVFISSIARNGQEALESLEQNPSVDLILMDIEMPVMNGIEATRIIRQKYPQIKIVMVTVYDDDNYIFDAIRAGADSYILKETRAEKIYETINDTLNGGAVMSPSIAVKTLNLLKNVSPFAQNAVSAQSAELTTRETEILELLSTGITNKSIAERLCISAFTVKRHIENIYQKLQAHNRIELLDKARLNRLI